MVTDRAVCAPGVDDDMAKESISLVLGSGGARGLTHIGVIRCLEERGYRISYISGSSIGALIGGIYAAGKLDVYTDWVCALRRRDVIRLLDWSFRRGALFTGDRLMEQLKKLIGEIDIEDLDVGFTAVATEINDKREVWLNRGALWDAVRASMAVPLVFPPVERDGQVFVDGGLINPVPIGPTLNDSSVWAIAVDLNGRAEHLPWADEPADEALEDAAPGTPVDQLRARITGFIDALVLRPSLPPYEEPSFFDLALRSMEVMQTTIGRMKLAGYAPRAIVPIPRNVCTFFEFHRAKQLIEFGYRRTRETLEREGL
jgi:NTE family protein